ncbi:radical SAM protein [Streptomyces virginiae]|uniref:radical SAM protein n=1 Tax=Streptomyces virginiae TaxID=1961 RepID=UPI0035D79045
MMVRAFASRTEAGIHLVYDPAAELTRRAPQSLPPGRCFLDDAQVRSWPAVYQRELATRVPLNVCWSPIVRCNLVCPQCLDDKSVAELRRGHRARIAGILAGCGALGLDISGGEPLLLPDLADLGRALRGGGGTSSCTTNGWHLARRAGELAGAFDAIRVSLDGPSAGSHDRIRGDGSFERACEGIRAAVHCGLPVQIHYTLMRSNAAGMQAVADLAGTLGATGVTYLQMLPIGEGAALREEMLSDAEATALLGAVRPRGEVTVRLRTREIADHFTVVRADGKVWRNTDGAQRIAALTDLRVPGDLHLPALEGSTP